MNLTAMVAAPVFGAGITVIAYVVGSACQRRWKYAQPLVITVGLLIACLWLFRIPYSSYKVGGSIISAFLSPATVALAVPLYHHSRRIRKQLGIILISCCLGAIFGVLSAWAVAQLAGLPKPIMLSVLPKSATAPICMEVVRQIGGIPELGALASVIAGLLGSIVGPFVLRLVGINTDIAVGAAMGTGSHGIGTARMLRESEFRGSVSALAMAVTGIFTALLTPLIQAWL